MATPPNRPKSSPIPDLPPSIGERRKPWMFVAIAVAVVVLVAALVAVFTAGGDEELVEGSVPTTQPGGSATTAPGASNPGETSPGASAEVWPVTITGEPLAALPDDGTDPTVGTPAPGLSGFTFDGSAVAVDPSKGPVLLVFLAHWCPHCNDEVPVIVDWHADGGVPEGLQVIAVTTAVDPSRDNFPPSSWIQSFGWPFPVLADSAASEAAQAFGLSGLPFSVIVGEDGTVLGRIAGELGRDGYEAWVTQTLANAAV
jgi:cytochrome c biogenesis protein CcmG, thiol:disulfide interchange protein DsbE